MRIKRNHWILQFFLFYRGASARYMQYMRNACRQCLFEMLHKLPTVVQRSRRNFNNIRLSLITDNSSLLQPLGHLIEQAWLQREAQLSSLCLRVGRSDDAELPQLLCGTEGKSANFPHCLQAPL